MIGPSVIAPARTAASIARRGLYISHSLRNGFFFRTASRLVAEGNSNQQIADALIIATGTVKKHLHNIFGKLGVQSRMQCLARQFFNSLLTIAQSLL